MTFPLIDVNRQLIKVDLKNIMPDHYKFICSEARRKATVELFGWEQATFGLGRLRPIGAERLTPHQAATIIFKGNESLFVESDINKERLNWINRFLVTEGAATFRSDPEQLKRYLNMIKDDNLKRQLLNSVVSWKKVDYIDG